MNKDSIIRALDVHLLTGRIRNWEHASNGNFVITGHGAASRVFTPKEAEMFCLGLGSAAQQPPTDWAVLAQRLLKAKDDPEEAEKLKAETITAIFGES